MPSYICKFCNKEKQVSASYLKYRKPERCKSCCKMGDLNPIKPGMHCGGGRPKVYDDNEIKRRRMAQTRAARGKRSHGVDHDWKVIYDVIFNSPHECFYCQKEFDVFEKRSFELDHKRPICRGGTAEKDNLCLACPSCNGLKSFMTAEEWMAVRAELIEHGYFS